MNPGDLRHAMRIEQEILAPQSPTGAKGVSSWVTVRDVYAHIAPLSMSDSQMIAASQDKYPADSKIIIRKFDGIAPQMRVRHLVTQELYDIRSITPDKTLTWSLSLYVRTGMKYKDSVAAQVIDGGSFDVQPGPVFDGGAL